MGGEALWITTMTASLSIIYYTSNRIADGFANAVRDRLLRSAAARFPIICVSHKPIDFGDTRVVVGDVVASIAQVYRNILAGCMAAQTEWCAAAEDDSLYVPEHWEYRPSHDTFAYNEHRFVITRRRSDDGRSRTAFYYARPRTQMAQGIFHRQLMIDALTEKFARYPNPPESTDVAKKAGWGEPGRYERNLGLTPRKIERFKWTERPNVTWNHSDSLMGRRAVKPDDVIAQSIEPWGEANELWRQVYGE